MRQLFVDLLPAQGELLTLRGDEEHYLGRSLRARPGEVLRLAAADGSAAQAVLEGFSDGAARLRVQRADPDPGLALDIALDLCPPKGDALEQSMDMAVQLGATRLRLVRSERTLASWGQGPLKAERLAKRLREAARQCLRARIPVLDEAVLLEPALRAAREEERLIMSERGGDPVPKLGAGGGRLIRVLVGPEGGFTAEELESAHRNGWRAISLGPRPLRTPTAVAAALAALNALCATSEGRNLEP